MTQTHAGDTGVVAQHFVEGVVPFDRHVAVLDLVEQLVLQDLLGAQAIAAMHQRDLGGDVGQVQRFLDSGVAATDHHDFLIAIEEAIAGRTGRDALAHELLLTRQAQILRAGAGGDDQGITAVAAVVTLEQERTLAEGHFVDVVEQDFGLEALGVTTHALHQLRPLHASIVAGPVVDVGGGGQLTTHLHAGDQERLEIGTCSVDGSGVTRRAGTENDQTFVTDIAHG